jgi:glycosyltransferase involved in cell wall biosynthesis
VIQTVNTIAALDHLGVAPRLYLPPWRGGRKVFRRRLSELGVETTPDIRSAPFLHSRWGMWGYRIFVRLHRSLLKQAKAVYTRSPEISEALASADVVHNLEIHDVEKLAADDGLDALLRHHHAGCIQWLIPVSRSAADLLIAAGAVKERIAVIPNGVDLDAFAQNAAFDPSRLDYPRMYYFGRISTSRGLMVFRFLAEAGIGKVILVGEQEDAVRDTASLTVQPFVPHREIPKRYEHTDLVLLPYQPTLEHVQSLCPIKLLEAMAAGRPIIASDIAPIREIIEHENTGLLVPPDDMDAWQAAVRRLQKDRPLAVRLAGAAKELATQFSWKTRACRMIETLRLDLSK